MATVYFAKWILLPSFEILHNGAISVENERILSIGTRSHIKRNASDRIVNLGDMLLLPGLINIHTHLEENVLRDMPKQDHDTFAAWIAKRNSKIKQIPSAAIEKSIRLGARELLTHGITTVTDFSRLGISRAVLSNEPIRSFIINETYPESKEEEDTLIDALTLRVNAAQDKRFTGCGPYALFSVSPYSHKVIGDFCSSRGIVHALHCAESSEELQAFSEQSGDLFFHITRKKGWPFGKVSRGSIDYALSENLIPKNALCIHCNYVNGSEFEKLKTLSASIVLCFQYSKELLHKTFPLDVAIKRGLLICAGTESISSQRSMNLFDELFCARSLYPHIPAAEMLRWITCNPAQALNISDMLGSLQEGYIADIIGIRFNQPPGLALLDELILGEPEVRLVIVNGEEIIEDY